MELGSDDEKSLEEADSKNKPETGEQPPGPNMAASNLPHVINLSNSIIGVTILAMPFCFKQCGILLGAVLLFFCTWLTLVSCRLLMKAGVTSRRRSYGFLAYYTYGAPGKLAVEIGMIGLQLGTLIAQVVIIGDLGPAIVSKYLGLENNGNLRMGLICFLCLCVGLPLGLLKNLNTVSRASTLCILFYGLFTVYVFSLSIPNLVSGEWINKVNLWKTDGLFKCLPIFSFAFGCQTQLFIMYDNLPEPSLKSVNNIVQSAVNMCTVSYLLTGFFGYIAFHNKDIGGDIVTDFEVSLASDILKLGFVISIAVTFPLIIFPCRGSLYTLLFPQKQKHSDDLEKRPVIPEIHFKVLTTFIVLGSMITGILVPNVEFVLAMNGATMGTLICYIFPAVFFLRVMSSSTDGKQIAQAVLIFGCLIMVLCTLTTLNAQEQVHAAEIVKDEIVNKDLPVEHDKEKPLQPPVINTQDKNLVKDKPPDKMAAGDKVDTSLNKDEKAKDKRVEPPNPREPSENENPPDKPDIKKTLDKPKEDSNLKNKKIDKPVEKKGGQEKVPEGEEKLQKVPVVNKEEGQRKDVEQGKDAEQQERQVKPPQLDKPKEGDMEEGDKEKKADKDKKQDEIINELEKQREEQRELIEEQKEILAQLKEHEQEHKQMDAEKQQANVGGEAAMINPQQVNSKQGLGQPMGGAQQQQVIDKQMPGGGQQPQVVNQPMGGQQPQVVNQPMGGQQQVVNQPIGGQQQVVNQPLGGQKQVVNQPVGGQQQIVNQPIGGQPQVVNQPIGGQQQIVNQPIGGQQQIVNQPIGGQQQVVNQPMGGQQQVVNQPMGGQQQVVNQPIGGQQPQVVNQLLAGQQPQVVNQPMGGQQPQVVNQPLAGQQPQVVNQPMGGQQQVVNQPMGGGQQQVVNQPMGGQQQVVNQPIGGGQQPGLGDQRLGNKQQAPGQVMGNFQQQPPGQLVDNSKHAANVIKETDRKPLPQINAPDQNANVKNANDPKIEKDSNNNIKKKSSKKHKKEHKDEVRHRRDVVDVIDTHNDNPNDEDVKPKPPNEEMRRKKLSINEKSDVDINDIFNKLDSMNDASLLHGRSLKQVLRKR